MGSNAVTGAFHNHVITFHSKPEFVVLPDSSLFERYNIIRNMSWGGNTNLSSVFSLILDKAIIHKLKQEDMPDKIFILSDMQFDSIELYSNKSNFEHIKHLYKEANYNVPKIIFWNIVGDTLDFPVNNDDRNVCLISGYSIEIIKSMYEDIYITPSNILRNVLDSDRYNPIVNILKNLQ